MSVSYLVYLLGIAGVLSLGLARGFRAGRETDGKRALTREFVGLWLAVAIIAVIAGIAT